jgi:rod shape determining protein RodA
MRQLYLEYPYLAGLFLFGENKVLWDSCCWYAIEEFTIQPSEFAKAAASLALAGISK